MRRLGITAIAAGSAGAGALAARFLEKSRRARLRDQAVAVPRRLVRRGRRRANQRTRYMGGVARGVAHRMTHPRGRPPADDVTLVQKVRSEVLGTEPFATTSINVDAAGGQVTLRGQLRRPEEINLLEKRVAKVRGVRDVENLVHAPGTPAANKRAARDADPR